MERDHCNKKKKHEVQPDNGVIYLFYVLENMMMVHPPFAYDNETDNID
jgi:hypothetical protein